MRAFEDERDHPLNFSRNIALWVIIGLLVFALFSLFQGGQPRNQYDTLAYSDFISEVESGEIREVTIQGQQIVGEFRNGRTFQSYAPDDPDLMTKLREQGVRVSALPTEEDSPTLWGVLISWFPMLLLIGVWIFFMRQM